MCPAASVLEQAELLTRLREREGDRVEFTRGAQDRRKIGEAICAFANDLCDGRVPGVLFIGLENDGSCAKLAVTDELLVVLQDFARNGSVVPLPVMQVRAVTLNDCRMVVVMVRPSENPPVKYDGRVCVRRGPARAYATPEEERRLTEKRRWGSLPFDQQPVGGSSVADLDLIRFRLEYLPSAVAPDVLEENDRDPNDQLRALRFLTPAGIATAVGLLVVGKDPVAWLPGAYVQFVRYPGTTSGNAILDEKRAGGPLVDQLRFLDEIIEANIARPANLGGTVQVASPTYPTIALQELIRNAVVHRTYEGTAAPVRVDWYDDRVEVVSPGGPYGQVTAANFGQAGVADYRNPALAEAVKALGYAQRFGSGIMRAQAALARNGNPPATFAVNAQFVHTTVRATA